MDLVTVVGDGIATIPDVLARAASLFGDDVAVVDGSTRATFAELDRRASAVAAGLIGVGVEVGDRVAIWAPNSLDWIVASFGVHLAGGVLVPISTRYKGPEAEHLLRTAQVKVLLAEDEFLGQDFVAARESMNELPELEWEFGLHAGPSRHRNSFDDLIAAGDSDTPSTAGDRRRLVSRDNASEIIFTSGTTGRPKGVVLTHDASVRTYAAWTDAVGLRRGDRHLVTYPFFHTAGLKSGVLASVMVGATVYVLPAFEADKVMATVQAESITVLPGAPTVFQMLLDHPERHRYDLSSLRCSVTGAAVVPVEVIRGMRDELDIETVVTGYGLSETCGTVSMCDHADPAEVVSRTVGRPLPGIEVRITDEHGDDVVPGTPGEVVVRGFNVMREYFDDPAATEAAFLPGGWLRTGDVGRFDDAGHLEITDRLKDMIIVGGFNVYPAEVEGMLLERHDVAQVAVVGAPDQRLGEVAVAFVVASAGASPDPDDLHAWCRERMANYKVPRRFEVVDDLPLTPTGKVLKPALRDLVQRRPVDEPQQGVHS